MPGGVLKIAIVGKGGAGKTTVSGILARALARSGRTVVALDCDTNPNLAIALGLGVDEAGRLVGIRQALDEGESEHAPSPAELLERFGTRGPDGIRVAVVTKIEHPNPGCG